MEQMRKLGGVCYCDRELTVTEVRDIIIALRKSESSVYIGENKENLFYKSNCELPITSKTYEAFTCELNKVFKKYNINTCLRRIHFLAQAYHETDRFSTTKEYGASEKVYAPYQGRGMMQLTWDTNYKLYKKNSGINCVDEPELIANNLSNAFDSAGWFWEMGKTLSNNKPGVWKAPSFDGTVGEAVAKEQASATKSIISYGTDSVKYGVINLNLLADNDWIDTISWLVNGGGNGFQERRNYLKKIKTIFNYENCINHK